MILSEQSDLTLVNMALTGYSAAYEELVRRWQRTVIGAAFSILKNHWLAEDAAQDAFVSAWLKLDTLREPERYGGWVCHIARNRARDLAVRHRGWTELDLIENLAGDESSMPDALLIGLEESEALRRSVDALPEKVRTVMQLHYYEGLSVAGIAERLNVPEGTVKWRLSDGRERLRRAYGVVEEKTFAASVMKRVDDFRLWRLKQDKTGLEEQYRTLLADIDKMPESGEKYHALADMLVFGAWWVPGEKNDQLIARVREAAERGKNDAAMRFVLAAEWKRVPRSEKIALIRDRQIPRLAECGLTGALGYAWFWLGCEYHFGKQLDSAREAFHETLRLCGKKDIFYANALSALRALDFEYPGDESMYMVSCYAEEYHDIDGKLRFWSQPGYCVGMMESNRQAVYIHYAASRCDGYFYDETLQAGEHIDGAGGDTLTFVSDGETVETPCGMFENCQLWRTKHGGVVDTYYKRGIGIVKQIAGTGEPYEQLLCRYHVRGDGLLPLVAGNRWEYQLAGAAKNERHELICECVFAEDKLVTMAMYYSAKRSHWDEDSWYDMMQAMRGGYVRHENGRSRLADVTHYIERAEALASTPAERAHTEAACSVMRRILDTDESFSLGRRAEGLWNFFGYLRAYRDDGRLTLRGSRVHNFEWKKVCGKHDSEYSLLYNDICGILESNAECVWSDEWQPGYEREFLHLARETQASTRITVRSAGDITTAAGTFGGCIEVALDTRGMTGGWTYRGGRKEYYFALGIGIVRTVNHFRQTKAVYELGAYTGVGEGMMPLEAGFMRRYDAIGLADGYAAWTVYTCSRDERGLVVFADRAGIKYI